MNLGFNKPLYIQPFDHRGSFQTKMFGWKGALNEEQTAAIAAAKQVIYDGFKAAVAGGVPKEKAGILVDEQFGAAILRDGQLGSEESLLGLHQAECLKAGVINRSRSARALSFILAGLGSVTFLRHFSEPDERTAQRRTPDTRQEPLVGASGNGMCKPI
jgi:hypothetical protein